MKYFFDTEFVEGFHKPLFGRRRHFIDLISIGIVCEDGRTFYAISNEVDLEMVWNKWQPKKKKFDINDPESIRDFHKLEKEYWLRDNVLKPIYDELHAKENYAKQYHPGLIEPFCLRTLKTLIRWNGKSNGQIAKEIENFVLAPATTVGGSNADHIGNKTLNILGTPVVAVADQVNDFYAYYADYDWVVLCSLFGRMVDLPDGFPMYCRDMKQMLDEKLDSVSNSDFFTKFHVEQEMTLKEKLKEIKKHTQYPQQENEHNALADAKWNQKLHAFIINL